jgi:DNA-binding protein YbaB
VEAIPPDAATEPPVRQEATDATGAVYVVVDARARVESVEISPRWRDRLDADALLAALLETYRTAKQQAVQAFATASRAAREAGERPVAIPGHAESPARPEPPPNPASDRGAWLRWLADLRATTEATLKQTAQLNAAADHGPRERTGPHGYLTATVQGDITAITGDVRAMWYASTEDLEQDAVAVLATGDSRVED